MYQARKVSCYVFMSGVLILVRSTIFYWILELFRQCGSTHVFVFLDFGTV